MIPKVQDLKKTYGKGSASVQALRGLSFEVKQGSFTVVMGKSGCGKSTLLHILSGILDPSEGHIIINNEDMYEMSDRHRTLFRKREIGLKKLIGFFNTEIFVQSTRKYLMIGLLSIGPAIAFGIWQYVSKLYKNYLLYLDAGDPIIPFNIYMTKFVSKSWDLFLSSGLFLLVFIVIIMVAIGAISWVLIARNPFELIDKKE